jgi:hypothetical protein
MRRLRIGRQRGISHSVVDENREPRSPGFNWNSRCPNVDESRTPKMISNIGQCVRKPVPRRNVDRARRYDRVFQVRTKLRAHRHTGIVRILRSDLFIDKKRILVPTNSCERTLSRMPGDEEKSPGCKSVFWRSARNYAVKTAVGRAAKVVSFILIPAAESVFELLTMVVIGPLNFCHDDPVKHTRS